MGRIFINGPQFIAGDPKDIKFKKLMFIRKGGRAIAKLGNISRHLYDAELICISDEDTENWIGNFAEGYGFFGVKFAKEDCREASDKEVELWFKDHTAVKF